MPHPKWRELKTDEYDPPRGTRPFFNYAHRCEGVDNEKLWVLTSSKVKWMISMFGVKCFHVDYVFILFWYLWYEKLRTGSSLTEIKAVELTDARRYVNMCKPVCFYIRSSRRILNRNSMGLCRLQEVSFQDTSLFVCLSYEYTCTLTRRDSSNIRSGLRVPNKPESTY